MRPATWTENHTETLKTLREQQLSLDACAKIIGFSRDFVRKKAANAGLTEVGAWPPEDIERLKSLWADGWTATQIAARLGRYTRSAILGKAHRLNLKGRNQSQARSAIASRALAKRKDKTVAQRRSASAKKGRRTREAMDQARAEAMVQIILPPEAAPLNATSILDLRNDQCRYPYGDTDFRFCPEEKSPGSSYCVGHHQKVYTGIPAARTERLWQKR